MAPNITDSPKCPVIAITCQEKYAPSIYNAPCAKLIIPSTPNTRVNPDATKNISIPIFRALAVV
jgi:hypothetical protein